MASRASSETRDRFFPIACPHCDSRCRIRGSRAVTPLIRESRVQCLNPDCGHTFVGQFVITHTISPSACPRSGVDLRIAAQRRPAAGNDNAGLDEASINHGGSGPEVPPLVDTG